MRRPTAAVAAAISARSRPARMHRTGSPRPLRFLCHRWRLFFLSMRTTEQTFRAKARREDTMVTEHHKTAPLARDAMAYVLAGGRGSRLMELTDRRAKPAVYFGGKSRI